jgi:hypothetical protein
MKKAKIERFVSNDRVSYICPELVATIVKARQTLQETGDRTLAVKFLAENLLRESGPKDCRARKMQYMFNMDCFSRLEESSLIKQLEYLELFYDGLISHETPMTIQFDPKLVMVNDYR